MSRLDTKRHDDLFNKGECDLPIHVIGTGGVGSHVTYMLAKLGVGSNPRNTLDLYDGDIIEGHNVSNQAYVEEHIGGTKVDTLAQEFAKWSSGNTATAHPHFVTEKIDLEGIVILCLDSMDARRDICRASIWGNPKIPFLIDARMDASNAIAFALDPRKESHVAKWEQLWFPDSQAAHRIGCGGPLSVITAVTMTAALSVQHFIAFSAQRTLVGIPNYLRISLNTWEGTVDDWDEEA
jgi:hypothetical protein